MSGSESVKMCGLELLRICVVRKTLFKVYKSDFISSHLRLIYREIRILNSMWHISAFEPGFRALGCSFFVFRQILDFGFMTYDTYD